jgi:hypothetical protein
MLTHNLLEITNMGTCAECKHFVTRTHKPYGFCTRYPPVVVVWHEQKTYDVSGDATSNVARFGHPTTKDTHICGEWRGA